MKLKKYINEGSLSRIQKVWTEHATGTITAFRGKEDCGQGKDISKKQNKARNAILRSKLLARGYGITKVKGAWLENNEVERGEMSFFVVDLNDSGKLRKDLIKLGTQFEQDAIIFAEKQGIYSAISSNECPQAWPGFGKIGVVKELGKPKFGKTGIDGFSRVGGRAFVFEGASEVFTKMRFFPTEIRSIMKIEEKYPDKESIKLL